jgi:nucleotide-binding universal stress UspA family protein
MMEIKKILWATDLSENASKALPLVTSLSERYQTEVHVVYVLEELGHFGAWYGEFDRSEIEKLQELEREKAEKKLDEICTLHLNHCPLYIRHTKVGDPASEILKLVEKERADLVVIASRGRKSHFDFGSVAEKIVRHSPAPVLVIPARKRT